MNIVTGRGRNRKILSLPCAAVINAAPEKQQVEARLLVCDLLGIKTK